MISFDCPACGKPHIVHNAKGGTQVVCAACGYAVPVPEYRAKSAVARRLFWAAFALMWIGVISGVLWLWQSEVRRPAVVQQRFQETITALSPNWRDIAWIQCEPNKGGGQYRVQLLYASDRTVYTFEVGTILGGHQTSVKIGTGHDDEGALAYALFADGEQSVFDYRGLDIRERDALNELARDVEHALRTAIG